MNKSTKIVIAVIILLIVIVTVAAIYLYRMSKNMHNQNNPGEPEDFDGIAISMDENPTTGFEWQYKIEPEGIIEVYEDKYVSDAQDSKEPLCGVGGTRYWKFKVVGEGHVEIEFRLLRGTEVAYGAGKIYKYDCDGKNAKLVEIEDIDGFGN